MTAAGAVCFFVLYGKNCGIVLPVPCFGVFCRKRIQQKHSADTDRAGR